MVSFVSIKRVTWGISNWVVNGQILEGRAICWQLFFFLSLFGSFVIGVFSKCTKKIYFLFLY